MSILRRKIFLCFFIITCFHSRATGGSNLDLEVILAGIQHYDSLIKSGDGDVTYKFIQTLQEPAVTNIKYHLIFNENKTRMEMKESFSGELHFPKKTYVATEKGAWTIQYDKSETHYTFSTNHNTLYTHQDLRWATTTKWGKRGLSDYLKTNRFKVIQKEDLGKVPCYVLANKKGERIWIAPTKGFRYFKYKHKLALKRDMAGLKKEQTVVLRTLVSYQKYGEVWFPNKVISEGFWLDSKGKKHLHTRKITETKNFQVNLEIPKEKFIIEIPEDTQIWVADLRTFMSKKKFLKYYNMK